MAAHRQLASCNRADLFELMGSPEAWLSEFIARGYFLDTPRFEAQAHEIVSSY